MVAEFTILGRLTRDVEMKYTASGQAVAKLDIAVNNRYKDKEEVSFFTVTVFGKSAENAAEYLAKGKQVFVSGDMRQRTWTTNDGEKKTGYEFLARKVVFIGGGKSAAPARPAPASHDDFVPEIDDDIVL